MDQVRYFRQVRDAALSVSVALPAAGASAFTPYLDLGSAEPGSVTEDFDVLIEVPATPNLANNKNVAFQVQDSAVGDNSDAATIVPLGPVTLTGTAGGGGAALSQRFRLPATTRQFIRFKVTADTGTGDVTGQNVTVSLVF